MTEPRNSRDLFRQYRAGDSGAEREIYDRYVARLLALAQSRLGKRLQRRFDAEDVVQSAYQSFFVRARGDQYAIQHSGDLWRLLAGITINKLRRHVEHHSAAKRTPTREEALPDSNTPLLPSLADVIYLAEELHLALSTCSDDERFALIAHLRGMNNEAIADELEKSERTVRRLLADAKQKMEQRLLADDPVAPSDDARRHSCRDAPLSRLRLASAPECGRHGKSLSSYAKEFGADGCAESHSQIQTG